MSVVNSTASMPRSFACSTSRPTDAVSGSVYVARGIASRNPAGSGRRPARSAPPPRPCSGRGACASRDPRRHRRRTRSPRFAADRPAPGVRARGFTPTVSRPEPVERQVPADGQQDLVALRGVSCRQLHGVGAAALRRSHGRGAHAEPEADTVTLEPFREQRGRAWMLAIVDARAWVDERGPDAVSGVDLGQLHAGRPSTEDHQGSRQLAGRGALDVGPGLRVCEAGEVLRNAADRADRQHHRSCLQCSVADPHPPGAGKSGRASEHGRARALERLHMARVVGLIRLRSVDHVIAERRCLPPWIAPAGVVNGRRVEQRLGGHAGPERARATEETTVHDGDRYALPPRVMGGGLARGPCADDDEIEPVHAPNDTQGGLARSLRRDPLNPQRR